jgi:hypothetical protein
VPVVGNRRVPGFVVGNSVEGPQDRDRFGRIHFMFLTFEK